MTRKQNADIRPFNEEAEEATLGSILIDHSILSAIRKIIKGPKDFHIILNGQVFGVLCTMADQGLDIDIVTVSEFLSPEAARHATLPLDQLERGQMDGRLSRYMNVCQHAMAGESYARIVRRKAIQRTCVATYTRAVELILSNSLDISEMLRKTVEMLEGYLNELS